MSKISLFETCNITTGKLDSNAAIENGKYPYFTCAPDPLRIDTYEFDDDVILLAGNNASGNFHCQRYKGKFNAYQRTYVITAKKGYDIDYIFYNLKINLQHLKKIAQGSQTKFLTMKILENFLIEDFDLKKQRKMVRLLSLLDNKINANIVANSELENMAKTIYDYWFLQFEFPNEKGKPYKSSGGKMIWNKELQKEIPEGWEVIKTAKRFNYIKGVEPGAKSYNEGYKEDFSKFYRVGDIDDSGNTYISSKYRDIASVSTDELLVTFDGTVGRIGIGLDGVYSTGMKKINDKENEIDISVIWALFNSDKFQKIIRKYATGSNILHASSSIPYLNFEYNKVIYKKYEKIVKPIYKKIVKNKIENKELKSLRDYLLPLLINRQYDLNENKIKSRKI